MTVDGGAATRPRIVGAGPAFFAATLIGLGVLGLIQGDFTPTWTGVPRTLPGRQALAYVCALVSLASGIGLLWRRAAVLAARGLLGYLLVWLLLFRLSHVLFAPATVATWWACGDTAVMVAGAWTLYAVLARDSERPRLDFAAGDKGLRIARVFYGLGLIPFGIAHFTYLDRTVPLVPRWLPWPVAWAYFTGAAFIAAGLAVLAGVCARLAATLSAVELASFTVLVWVPIVAAGANAFQWTEFVVSWALTAGAWVVAESYRGRPWLARGRRA